MQRHEISHVPAALNYVLSTYPTVQHHHADYSVPIQILKLRHSELKTYDHRLYSAMRATLTPFRLLVETRDSSIHSSTSSLHSGYFHFCAIRAKVYAISISIRFWTGYVRVP